MRIGITLPGILWLLVACSTTPPGKSSSAADYAAAEEAYRNGAYSQAVSVSTSILEENPGTAKPHFLRAKSYQAMSQWEEAEADFAKAVELSPDQNRSVYLFWRGLFFSDRKLHEKALLDLSRACELQLRFPSPQYYLEIHRAAATTRITLGQYDAARKDCDFILSKNPDDQTRREFEALKQKAIRGMRKSVR